jgi:hypothetical protein
LIIVIILGEEYSYEAPTFRHFISLRFKYSSQRLVLKHPPLMSDTKFDVHTEPKATLFICIV